MANIVLNLKKELKTKEIVFGTKTALKYLKSKSHGENIVKIYLAKDCLDDAKQEIKKLSENFKQIEVIVLENSREELKELCKKPFNISVVIVLGEKKKLKKEPETKKEKAKETKTKRAKTTKEKTAKKEKKESKKGGKKK